MCASCLPPSENRTSLTGGGRSSERAADRTRTCVQNSCNTREDKSKKRSQSSVLSCRLQEASTSPPSLHQNELRSCAFVPSRVKQLFTRFYLLLGTWYSRVPSKRVAMVSRKVFCGASSPLITGILLRVDWVLLPRRPGAALDSCSDPKLGRKREVPGAHPSPWRSAPIRDTRGGSTLTPRGL